MSLNVTRSLGGAWTAYTPTWSAETTPVGLGDGTISGAYIQHGKLVIGRISLVMGSTTTYGSGPYRFTLPVTAASPANTPVGVAHILDNGVANYTATVWQHSTTLIRMTSNVNGSSNVTATVPITFAVNDAIRVQFTYEAA